MRNPSIIFYGTKIKLIGDPHLGKIFKRNVPISKLGLREKQMYKAFEQHLIEGNTHDYTIIVGDLFDSFRVSNEALATTFKIIIKFLKTSKTKLIIIPGNHDLSKDKTKISSYSILYSMLESYFNDKFTMLFNKSDVINLGTSYLYLDVYDPFYKQGDEREKPFLEQLEITKPLLSIGHWDDPRFDTGYLPSNYLLERSEKLCSGHIHSPETFLWKGIEWSYTGSLEPYSHSEDPEGILYKTYTYEEIESIIKSDIKLEEEGIADKNIRINCYPGYFLPVSLDCMSLTYNPILPYPETKEDSDKIEVNDDLESLDLSDFNTMYLYTLKEEYELEDDLLIKINNFLKDETITEFKL